MEVILPILSLLIRKGPIATKVRFENKEKFTTIVKGYIIQNGKVESSIKRDGLQFHQWHDQKEVPTISLPL